MPLGIYIGNAIGSNTLDVAFYSTSTYRDVTSGDIIYRRRRQDSRLYIDYSDDNGLTWEVAIAQFLLSEDVIEVTIDDSPVGYRDVVRDGAYKIDQLLEGGTGDWDTEGTDWENIISIESEYWSSYWTARIENIISTDNIVAYYKMWDKSGSVCTDVVNGYNGTYYNTILDQNIGKGKGILTGATSRINIYSTPLVGAMDFNEGSIAVWFKMDNAIWADGLQHHIFFCYGDANNAITIHKSSASNIIGIIYKAGGVTAQAYLSNLSNNGLNCLIVTWSKSAHKIHAYFNGKKTTPQTNITSGDWNATGVSSSDFAIASQSSNSATLTWVGYLAHFVIAKKVISETEASQMCDYSAVLFDGDSRTYGSATLSYSSVAIGNHPLGIINTGVPGGTLASLTADAASRVDTYYSAKNKVLVFWAGVNSTGLTTQQLYDAIKAYCQARKAIGWSVVVCTEIDCQHATQVANNWSTKYLELNTMLRADYSFADRLADLGENAALQDATDTTYFNADKIHLIQAGYNVVGSIVAPHITALL
jgi:hypothetical protein